METENVAQLIETSNAKWKPAKLEGIDFLPLHTDRAERKGTFLFRMQPGTCYTRHRHPGGEELLMLKGSLEMDGRKLKAGDFLYSPPGTAHELKSEKGCMFLVVWTDSIEIVVGGNFEEIEPNYD